MMIVIIITVYIVIAAMAVIRISVTTIYTVVG